MKNSTLFKKMMFLFALVILGYSYSLADSAPIFSEPFGSLSFGNFTPVSVSGDQTWDSTTTYGAKMSGYASSVNHANEDWLISPTIDLAELDSAKITFSHANWFKTTSTPATENTIWISSDYVSGDPSTGTWTQLLIPTYQTANQSYTYVESGSVSIPSSFIGKAVKIAFKYLSTDLTSSTWEIKNVVVTGFTTPQVVESVVFSENFDKATANSTASPATVDISTTLDTYTNAPGWTGTKVYQAGGGLKMGSSGVAGLLTTPAIDLSAKSGTFKVSFKSLTWSGDTTHLQIYVNDVLAKEITGLNNDANYQYKEYGPFEFTGGTAATKIKFATSLQSTKNNRFYLDSLVIKQGAATTPKADVTTSAFKVQAGNIQNKKLALTASNLTGNLTVALANVKGTAFSTTISTISKANAQAGDSIPVSYAPSVAGMDTAIITISGGGLASNVLVTIVGGAYKPVVANLAELRAAFDAYPDNTVVYTVTGEVFVSLYVPTVGASSTSASVYLQDATGGLLVYDSRSAIITSVLEEGNGIKNLTGTLTQYYKLMEMVPTVTPTVNSTGTAIVPVQLTISEARAARERYESTVVYIKQLTNNSTSTFWGTTKQNLIFKNGVDSVVVRAGFTTLDFMGAASAIPTVATDYAGLLVDYNGTIQFFPRKLTDIGYNGAVVGMSQTSVVASVWGSNGTLNVQAAQGQSIEVYNLMGQRLMKTKAIEGLNTFNLSKNQLYLVRVNNHVSKIVL